MKRSLLVIALSLTACGGTWSNKDLEFTAALPTRAELASTLPTASSTSQPLRDGLNAGEPSQAYADTKKAVTDFNGLLDFLLGVVDAVRTLPPTTRSDTARSWGPFDAKDNPGFQLRITIALVSTDPQDTYGWKLESRKIGGEWFDVVRGGYQASEGSVRKGMGQIVMPVKDFRDVLTVDPGLKQLDSIEIGYVKTDYPHLTQMVFKYAPGNMSGLSAAGYASKRAQDGSGAMGYSIISTDVNATKLDIVSKWRADGAGLSVATIAEGNQKGATRLECWNSSFKVTFFKETWVGGKESGLQSDCISVDSL